jgi:alpha-beta hydrolase superfamily lysophospholipase
LQKDVISLLKTANPNLPLFIYGHSLGGLTIASLAMDYPYLNIAGMILTSPFLGLSKTVHMPPIKLFLVKAIGHRLE